MFRICICISTVSVVGSIDIKTVKKQTMQEISGSSASAEVDNAQDDEYGHLYRYNTGRYKNIPHRLLLVVEMKRWCTLLYQFCVVSI